MSDQQVQPTQVDLLVDRLAQRIGQLTTENEWLKVQLELLQQQQTETDSRLSDDPSENGSPSHDVQVVI